MEHKQDANCFRQNTLHCATKGCTDDCVSLHKFFNAWVLETGGELDYVENNHNRYVDLDVNCFDFLPCQQTFVDMIYGGAPPI